MYHKTLTYIPHITQTCLNSFLQTFVFILVIFTSRIIIRNQVDVRPATEILRYMYVHVYVNGPMAVVPT